MIKINGKNPVVHCRIDEEAGISSEKTNNKLSITLRCRVICVQSMKI